MDKAQMLRQQRQQRATWHELDDPPRRALQIRRPTEDQVIAWRSTLESLGKGGDDNTAFLAAVPKLREIVGSVVIGWRGFTEADLLGPAVGASSPQDFDAEVFAEWVQDETMLLVAIASDAVKSFKEHRDKKAAAEKN
jgi:hypothetical protein